MPNNVDDVTHGILKSIQASIATLAGEVHQLADRVDHLTERFDRLEAGLRKDRRNVAGMLVMMRATAGDFDERVAEVEERVAALEAQAH